MRRLAALAFAALLFAAGPAFAQQVVPAPAQAPAAVAAAPAPAPAPAGRAPAAARPGFSSGHALALGVGMFAGAVLGSAMIHGGSFAAAVGAVAGLAAGHWYYTQQHTELD